MDANREQYKKLFVLSPTYYNKLRKQYDAKVFDNHPLDQVMFQIMQNKQTNINKKWLMYRDALIKFNELKKENNFLVPEKSLKIEEQVKKDFASPSDVTKLSKTNRSYFWDYDQYKSPQKRRVSFAAPYNTNSKLFNTYRKSDGYELDSSMNNSDSLNKSLSVFGSPIDSPRNQDELFENDPEKNMNDSVDKEAVEEQIYNIAKESLGEANEENVIRLDDISSENYRVFTNPKTRDLVAVEVSPIQNSIKNNVHVSLRKQVEPRKDVSPVLDKSNEYEVSQRQAKFIHVGSTPITSINDGENRRSIHLRGRTVKRRLTASLQKERKEKKSRKNRGQQEEIVSGAENQLVWDTY